MRNSIVKLFAVLSAICILSGASSCSRQSSTPPDTSITVTAVPSESTDETTTESETESETETETATEETSGSETETTTEETTTSKATSTSTPTAKPTKKPTSKPKNLSPKWVRNLSQAKKKSNKQLLIVAADGMNKSTAKVSMHERDSKGNWIQVFSVTGYVGKNGMVQDSKRVEGSKKTPIGVYKFNKAFGIAKDPGCSLKYTKVTDDLYWSGDSRKGMYYNQMVSIKKCPDLDKTKSEHLIDYKTTYQYCLNISFNDKGVAGKGSAIFLHCTGSNKYTSGCIAIPKSTMKKAMKRVKKNCVVIINTKAKLGA